MVATSVSCAKDSVLGSIVVAAQRGDRGVNSRHTWSQVNVDTMVSQELRSVTFETKGRGIASSVHVPWSPPRSSGAPPNKPALRRRFGTLS
ncbi:hypothetical protein EVAR_45344_1 [Eumeta japonica]|uniref:Uncharacterized protein n=1 Tax=Eumeta variegata TaxID=151549 RepID=A0A4C1XK37_EUMVA|nr:hypothetical protein EVAR_45344_1 [Eumeta japonica]